MLSGNGVVDQVSRSLRLLQPPLKLFSVALSTMATHSSQFKTEERRNISHLQCVILACGVPSGMRLEFSLAHSPRT